MREGETPVPIPNTTVKTFTAESTMRVTAWEGRWMPDIFIYFISDERLNRKIQLLMTDKISQYRIAIQFVP